MRAVLMALLCLVPSLALASAAEEALSGDMVTRTKVRWSKLDGERVAVQVQGGEAVRLNPNWSPEPAKLQYDLTRNKQLESALRGAHLGPPNAHAASSDSGDRTLELLTQDKKGAWGVVAVWVHPVKLWRKGRLAAIYEHLEPLLDTKPDLFQPMKGGEKER